jgi:3(or 17)beta-hydroxysteroid dehydrogenase
MTRLQGKSALVTGGAAGIGKSIAEVFAAEGAIVIISDMNEQTGRKVADELCEKGGKALFLIQDVTREEQWQSVTDAIVKDYGKLDIVVNNAGVTDRGNVESISLADWKAVLDVNLNGVFLGTKYGIKAMKNSGGGSIVNISSIEGLIGDPNISAYTASKGGVRIFTKSSALYCAREKYNIRINSIHPGVIRTAILSDHIAASEDPEAELQRLASLHPIGFIGDPEDIAFGALYLASNESRFVTGSELVIDGGYTAQ